jgi:hypothetical protein
MINKVKEKPMRRSFRFLKRINERIATSLSDILSTMACFWVIAILVLAVLEFQCPHTPLEWIQYVVQTFFQGVALPVLAFVSKKEGDRSRKMNTETHDIVMKEFRDLKDLHDDLAGFINRTRCAELKSGKKKENTNDDKS